MTIIQTYKPALPDVFYSQRFKVSQRGMSKRFHAVEVKPFSEHVGKVSMVLTPPFWQSEGLPWDSYCINYVPFSSCLSLSLGSLTPCLYKFPDHGLGSGSCALSHSFSTLPPALLTTDEAPGVPSICDMKTDHRKSMRDPEDVPPMDSPQIRELEMFANDFKIRRIKLG